MYLKKIEGHYGVEATTPHALNFGVLTRKLTTLSVILTDLKKAAQQKEEDQALTEIKNLKDAFSSLIHDLQVH
jgi:hypothetical protein